MAKFDFFVKPQKSSRFRNRSKYEVHDLVYDYRTSEWLFILISDTGIRCTRSIEDCDYICKNCEKPCWSCDAWICEKESNGRASGLYVKPNDEEFEAGKAYKVFAEIGGYYLSILNKVVS